MSIRNGPMVCSKGKLECVSYIICGFTMTECLYFVSYPYEPNYSIFDHRSKSCPFRDE